MLIVVNNVLLIIKKGKAGVVSQAVTLIINMFAFTRYITFCDLTRIQCYDIITITSFSDQQQEFSCLPLTSR